jgi:predicted Rossmann fold flavoprotein
MVGEGSVKRIGIIGAGPAGMIAALQAARGGCDVSLLDSNPQAGRKLLVTGAGRCNITNQHIHAGRYSGTNPSEIARALARFDQSNLRSYLDDLGILTYATADGWVYPISNSAANVTALLSAHIHQAGVHPYLNTTVRDIHYGDTSITVITDQPSQDFNFDRLIIASGGKAYPNLGSRGSLFPILSRLGHTILPVLPALAPVLTDTKRIHKLQGVRLDAAVSLHGPEGLLGQAVGNIIFTEWGINGPGVMDLSHLVARNDGQDLSIHINFLPHHEKQIKELITGSKLGSIPLSTLLGSILPARLVLKIYQTLGLPAGHTAAELGTNQVERILRMVTGFKIGVKGTRGFEFSQASSGGVSLDEIDPDSMQSKILPGIYFAGEVLDVVGPCGGYNLQWAITSGYLAGCAASGN